LGGAGTPVSESRMEGPTRTPIGRLRWPVLLAAAALALNADSARAGTYDVLSCAAAPGGVNRAWTASSSSPYLPAFAQCPPEATPGYGGLIARNSPQNETRLNRPGTAAAQVFAAPAGASIVGLVWGGYLVHRGDRDGAGYEVGLVDDSGRWRDEHCFGPRWCPRRRGRSALGLERVARHRVAVPNRRSLAFVTICRGVRGRPCRSRSTGDATSAYLSAGIMVTYARVRIADATRPTLGRPAGPLWEARSHRGTEAVRYRASDDVGIRAVRLLVDGRPKASRAPSCDFTRRTPCPRRSRTTLPLDTRALENGRHALTLRVVDAAGNTAVVRRIVDVANAGGGDLPPFALAPLLLLAILAPVVVLLLPGRQRPSEETEPAFGETTGRVDPDEARGGVEEAVDPSSPGRGPRDRQELRDRIAAMRADGMTLQAIADLLNAEGVPTLRGGATWRPSGVQSAAGYRRPRRGGSVAASERENGADR
jgi:hypothetical protein